MEGTVKTISQPVINRVVGPSLVGQIDNFACRQLDRVRAVQASSATVITDTFYLFAVRPAHGRISQIWRDTLTFVYNRNWTIQYSDSSSRWLFSRCRGLLPKAAWERASTPR
jgi:hypothetical protein